MTISQDLLKVLADAGRRGLTVDELSSELKVNKDKLTECLKAHKDFFVRLPGSNKYIVNRFGRYRGDTEKMKRALLREQGAHDDHYEYYFYCLLLIVSTFLVLQELANW